MSRQQKKCPRCNVSPCQCSSPSSVRATRNVPSRSNEEKESVVVEPTNTSTPTVVQEAVAKSNRTPGSSFFFTDSIESMSIEPGETIILSLNNISTDGNQSVKLEFTDRLEIETFPDSSTFGFNITYRIIRINTIACFTLVQDSANTCQSNHFSFLNPNLTWTDTPPAGTHTYEVRVTLDINSGSFKSAIIHDRSLHAMIFPPSHV